MSSRPRPVTATVTKPQWMLTPDPEAIARVRRLSLGSNGSTASLVSLLDHDSYISAPSDSEIDAPKVQLRRRSPKRTADMMEQYLVSRKEYAMQIREPRTCRKTRLLKASSTSELSPWETWLLEKTQEERQRKQQERQRKNDERSKTMEEQREKEEKLAKAERVRREWEEKKNVEEILRRKIERQKIRNEKSQMELKKQIVIEKTEDKLKEWMRNKQIEERKKKREEKEKKRREEELKELKAERSEQKFQEWKKAAAKRPKSAPSSYGLLDGKIKGYHDNAAYPSPSYCNPIPWQPVHIPKVKTERPKRTKAKKYVWNPNKYY